MSAPLKYRVMLLEDTWFHANLLRMSYQPLCLSGMKKETVWELPGSDRLWLTPGARSLCADGVLRLCLPFCRYFSAFPLLECCDSLNACLFRVSADLSLCVCVLPIDISLSLCLCASPSLHARKSLCVKHRGVPFLKPWPFCSEYACNGET